MTVTKARTPKTAKRKGVGQLWNDFQATPIAPLPEPSANHWAQLLALVVGEWQCNRQGQLELLAPREWTRRRRLNLADELLWALRFKQGQVWLNGETLCVQPVALAQSFAPLIKALKVELILLLREEV